MIVALWFLIFLLGIFLVLKEGQNENQNLPPGPWGLPLLGHLVSLGMNPHLTLMKWKQKYGPIISCRFGSFPTVVLCDSKLIKEAFSMTEFSGRPQLQAFQERNDGKGFILGEGSHSSELRHFAIRQLKEFGIGRKQLEDQIHEGISEFMDFIKRKIKEGTPVNSEAVPSAHIIRTLWSIMMSGGLDAQEVERLNHLLSKLAEMGPVLSELAGFMPWLEKMARIITFGQYSLISHRSEQFKELYSFGFKLMQEKETSWAKSQNQGQVPADIMEKYLEKVAKTTDKSSAFHMSQGSAAYFLGDNFGAGIHTVHTSLVWMFYYAARNREVQLKLQAEIDQVIGNSASRLPSLSDQGQMPYADGFVHEVLRLSPPVPLGLPRNVTKDVCFHGYNIKKNTMAFANIYGVHHDPEIWGDPENCRPERWFGETGKRLKNEHFFPFSTGRRNCVGEGLALEQLFLYATTLFQEYTVDFDLGKVPEVKGMFGLVCHPSQFSVTFCTRKMQ